MKTIIKILGLSLLSISASAITSQEMHYKLDSGKTIILEVNQEQKEISVLNWHELSDARYLNSDSRNLVNKCRILKRAIDDGMVRSRHIKLGSKEVMGLQLMADISGDKEELLEFVNDELSTQGQMIKNYSQNFSYDLAELRVNVKIKENGIIAGLEKVLRQGQMNDIEIDAQTRSRLIALEESMASSVASASTNIKNGKITWESSNLPLHCDYLAGNISMDIDFLLETRKKTGLSKLGTYADVHSIVMAWKQKLQEKNINQSLAKGMLLGMEISNKLKLENLALPLEKLDLASREIQVVNANYFNERRTSEILKSAFSVDVISRNQEKLSLKIN